MEDHILNLANECVLHSENSIEMIDINFNSAIQFLNEAFFCVKKLEDFYFSDFKNCNSELLDFCKHFYHFNEIVLKYSDNKEDIHKELNNLKSLYDELKDCFSSCFNGIDIRRKIVGV
ncbi:hypothetical protein [Sebaldella sp. S0638]|jgi:hypothetical protein|uniref:hypothetical protein n=1 Tax=Sebaldella sp. S0638 TaxID=2957809 RepID=UPI0020A03016|nr:hypothetical protein [Sebaldella sp. S0638]MCP1226742.1 hypothetical protein [Sebaldella sp. S0638]